MVPEGISSLEYSVNLCFQCTPNTAWSLNIPNIFEKKEQLFAAFLTLLLSCLCKVSGLEHTEHRLQYMPHSVGESVPALVRAGSLPKGQYMHWSSCYPHGLLHPSNQMFPITLCTLAIGHYIYFLYLALVSFLLRCCSGSLILYVVHQLHDMYVSMLWSCLTDTLCYKQKHLVFWLARKMDFFFCCQRGAVHIKIIPKYNLCLSKTPMDFFSNRRFLWNNQANKCQSCYYKSRQYCKNTSATMREVLLWGGFNGEDKHLKLQLQVKSETISTTN